MPFCFFRCCDLFLVGKIGHLRTTSLVSLVVAGKPDHTEALDKQNQGMSALDRISFILLPELPMSWRHSAQDSLTVQRGRRFRAMNFQCNSSLPCRRVRHKLPICYHFPPCHMGRPSSSPVANGRSGSIFKLLNCLLNSQR